MATVRTTITFEKALYRSVVEEYKKLGFARMGDLVNEAVREFLHRQTIQNKHRAMARAAEDARYRSLLKEISDEFRDVDSEGLPDY